MGAANFKVRNLEEKEFPLRIKKKERLESNGQLRIDNSIC